MAPTAGRSLHVRCATWEQVEVFYTRKLRRGKLLSMRVPFHTEVGAQVTLGLELPNGVVIAIDGVVQKASPIEGEGGAGKTWIEVELVGFNEDVIARIKALAAQAAEAIPAMPASAAPEASDRATRAAVPAIPPMPAIPLPRASAAPVPVPSADEAALFQHLTAELRRMRSAGVHEVLGVAHEADAREVRRAWMSLVQRVHPDLVARRNAPAIAHLAEELTILANRAYDRLRAALVADGRATAVGPALQQPPGWLVGFEDISSTAAGGTNPRAQRVSAVRRAVAAPVAAVASSSGSGPQGQGGDMFESRARTMLGDGDAANAQEVLAAALCVYPRSRPLRSLYYVASAITALEKGEVMLATSQLETALAHHEQCSEAAAMLELVRRHGGGAPADAINGEMRRLFQSGAADVS